MLGFRGKIDPTAIDSNVYDLNSHFEEHAFDRLISPGGYQPFFSPNLLHEPLSTLSNSNKTITNTDGATGVNYVLNSVTSGKYYVEFVWDNGPYGPSGDQNTYDNSLSVGVINLNHGAGTSMNTINNSDAFGARFGTNGPEATDNLDDGDIVGLALDADNNNFYVYVNNILQSNMSGSFSVTGALFLGIELWDSTSVTLTDIDSYTYTAPSGFVPGWAQSTANSEATWDISFTGNSLTYSSDKRDITGNGGGLAVAAVGGIITGGTHYIELKEVPGQNIYPDSFVVGFIKAESVSLFDRGNPNDGAAWIENYSRQTRFRLGRNSGYTSISNSDVIGVGIDYSTGNIFIRKNNSNEFSAQIGFSYPNGLRMAFMPWDNSKVRLTQKSNHSYTVTGYEAGWGAT